MSLFLLSILTFVAMFVTDVCWAICVAKAQQRDAQQAGLWALLLFVTTGVATICYTQNNWLLIPAAAGAYAGTYAGVWWTKFIEDGRGTMLSLMEFYKGETK